MSSYSGQSLNSIREGKEVGIRAMLYVVCTQPSSQIPNILFLWHERLQLELKVHQLAAVKADMRSNFQQSQPFAMAACTSVSVRFVPLVIAPKTVAST